ncbi:MAG: hypothetical protein H0W81_07390 [Chloroflexi bacterium]|nr:hypothetical protein [Chloroflexota bacterium]
MQTKFWVRRVVLALVWGLAIVTWASIAHYLAGMPNVGAVLALATMTFIVVRPARRGSVARSRSNASDAAMHAGAPTA